MKLPVIFILLIPICAASLAADQTEYLPLHVGDESISDVTTTAVDGRVTHSLAYRKIEAGLLKNGQTYLRLKFVVQQGKARQQAIKLVRREPDGLHTLDEAEKDAVEVPLPLIVGETWHFQSGGKATTGNVVAVEAVTLGEKTYENCIHIHVQLDDGSLTEDRWEAPKIGRVKTIAVYRNGPTVTTTLRESKPAK